MILKRIKNIIFKDYSTDIALRYLPVVDLISKYKLRNSKILEVGSGDLGITPYFNRKIVGIDIKFNDQNNGLLKKIKFDGEKFPFSDDEFDLTISVDNLEHIAKNKRENFLKEILRVTREGVIIVVPCGQLSFKQDKRIAGHFSRIYNNQDIFLKEHLLNGLPEDKEIIKMMNYSADKLHKKIQITETKNLLNLKIRYFIMRCKISKNPILNISYYLFLIFLPFRRIFNFGDCYRKIFFMQLA